jgi:hypothetical protein
MLLYIILFVVTVILVFDPHLFGPRLFGLHLFGIGQPIGEGFIGVEGTTLALGSCRGRNSVDGKWDETRRIYTNDNDALYQNYQNVLAYASGFC